MKACLLGSTGVIVETSRLQRLAYNAAFEELGLDMYWNVAAYCSLLKLPGEFRRLDLALGDEAPVGLADDVQAVQQKHFAESAKGGLNMRPGVADLIAFCKRNEIRLAWVTTEASTFIQTLLEQTAGLDASTFDLVCTRGDVAADKPDPAIYRYALSALGERASDVIAVEDTVIGQSSAFEADLQCYLNPGEYASVDSNVLVTRDLYQTVTRAHSLWSRDDDVAMATPGQISNTLAV